MANQYLTLGEIKQAAIYRADLEGISDRHPSLNLNFEANASMRALRTKMANNDVLSVMTTTALLNLPTTGALSNAAYWAEVPWPTDAVSIHGLDVLISGEWDRIEKGALEQRARHQRRTGRGELFRSDAGAMWSEKALPQGSAAPGTLMLFPVPSTGQYLLWYLTQWVDIITDTAEFPGQEHWLQWVIWDVAVKCLIRDEGQAQPAQLVDAKQERDRVWGDIKPNLQRLVSDGPLEVQSRYGSRRFYGQGGARLIP
jgi:hypothetical protein